MPVVVRGPGLQFSEVARVARQGERAQLDPDARARMERSRRLVEEHASGEEPVYGINTGFGALAMTHIAAERRSDLQHALIRSHAAGAGEPVEAEVVRAMMLLRARTLAMGLSGARPAVAEALLGMLNAGLLPVVPEHGSVGCSGDLAPLAHVALAAIGEGEVVDSGGRAPSRAALEAAGMEPLRLEAKEGLALINGTDGMLAMLVLACEDLDVLLKTADVTAALSCEALLGTDRPYREELQRIRPHPGQVASAANLRRLLAGSGIVASHRHSHHAVQDSYSVRCAPQVAGAARDTLAHAAGVARRELDSAVDNPVVLEDGSVESTGNFHGAPLALACDHLAVAVASLGSISERRVDRLLDPARSSGLPAFLAADPGLDSGLMVAQYTAAALAAENRRLAVPASADSIPTSAMQEDHNSMGWGAARKLRRSLRNLGSLLAIELVAAARGIDLRAPLQPAAGTAAVVALLRESVPGPGPDRPVAPELARAETLVRSGAVVRAAEAAVGELA